MRTPWTSIPYPARVVLAADLISNTGTGLVLAFTAIYVAHIHHHGPAAGALAVAAVAAGSMPGNAAAGRATDRHGAAAVLGCGWVLAAYGDLALIAASSTAALLAACLVVGAGAGAAYPALNTLLGELTGGDTRRLVFGAHHGLVNVGFSLGALGAAAIVAPATPSRFHALYALDAASFLAAATLITTRVGRPPPAPGRALPQPGLTGSYRQVLGDRSFRRLCAISGLIVMFGYSQFHAALPLILSHPGGLAPGAIAMVYAVNTVTVAAIAVPVVALTRRARRPRLMAAGAACFATCWALLGASGHVGRFPGPVLLAIAAAAVMGIGETLLSPSLGPTVNELAPPGLRGRYNAADSLVFSVGSLSGPALTGLLLSNTGSAGLLATLIFGCLTAAAVAGTWSNLGVRYAGHGGTDGGGQLHGGQVGHAGAAAVPVPGQRGGCAPGQWPWRQRAQVADFNAKTGALELAPEELAVLCAQVRRTLGAATPPSRWLPRQWRPHGRCWQRGCGS